MLHIPYSGCMVYISFYLPLFLTFSLRSVQGKGAGNIPSESCWSLQSKSPQNNQTENGLNPAKLLGLCQEKMNGVLMPWYNIGKE